MNKLSGVIFDLDQTLIDSTLALQLRKSRSWSKVYAEIPKFELYDNIYTVLNLLEKYHIPTCIVTTSPSNYCNKVTQHFRLNIPMKVCYHDTAKHKPDPEPILMAINKMNIPANEILSLGDDVKDIVATKSAGAVSGACLWGCSNRNSLLVSSADFYFNNPKELHEFIETKILKTFQ